jgi:uncharacterized protein (TIGR02271 family)
MTHELYSESDNWEVENDEQDVRGWNVVDEQGQQLGTVRDMYVDTQTETIDRLVLDNGSEVAVSSVLVEDGTIRVAGGLDSMAGADRQEMSGSAASADRSDTEDTWRIRRHEEELQATKERQQTGEVQINKNIVEEERSIDVPVSREEVEIRRVPVDRSAEGAAISEDQDTIRVPVMAEKVHVSKEPRVVEELEISKTTRTGTERVSDTVRREEFDIENEGDANVRENRDR